MIERVLSLLPGAEMDFIKIAWRSSWHKVCSCEINKSLDFEPLLQNERSQRRWFDLVTRVPWPDKRRWRVLLATPTEPEAGQGPDGVITSLTWLFRALRSNLQTFRSCWKPWGSSRDFGLLPQDSPSKKCRFENKWMNFPHCKYRRKQL